MVQINLIGWLAVTSTVFNSIVVEGTEEVPQITRDINTNDASRRLYNGGGGEAGGSAVAAVDREDLPSACSVQGVLWTEAQCRDYVLNSGELPGVDWGGARSNTAVKGCFYQVNINRAFWGEYSLNNDDYLIVVGEDFDRTRQVRIYCNRAVVPTQTPTEFISAEPTGVPTEFPTGIPTPFSSNAPTSTPTEVPTTATMTPTDSTEIPTELPTELPTMSPSDQPTLWPTTMDDAPGDNCDDDDDKWGGGKGWGCGKHNDDDDDDWSGGRSRSSGGKWNSRSRSSGGSKAYKRRSSEWRRSGGGRKSSWSSVSNDGGKSNWRSSSSTDGTDGPTMSPSLSPTYGPTSLFDNASSASSDNWSGSSSESSGGKWRNSRSRSSGGSKAHKRRRSSGGKSSWSSSSSKNNSAWRRPRWESLRQAEFDVAPCYGTSEEETSKECGEVTVDGACIERCTITIDHKCNRETLNVETIKTDDRKSDTPC